MSKFFMKKKVIIIIVAAIVAIMVGLIIGTNIVNTMKAKEKVAEKAKIEKTIEERKEIEKKIKKVESDFANVTYVPSFPRQAFYKTPEGNVIPDPHYNHAEYYHFLSEVENKIIDNYHIRDLMIDMDRVLYQMSNDNDLNGTNYSKNDVKDVIDETAKKYENKTGDYNYFIDFAKSYIKGRYASDFFRASPDNNLTSDMEDMKRHK